jgi:hypothetical protein
MLGTLAVFAAAPLAAQGNFRTGGVEPTRGTAGSTGSVLGRVINGGVLGQDPSARTQSRKSDHVPPGQLPPAGMCRIWIDGVPPGQQPAPTDCQTAVATKPANARVLWGDQTAFPGKGKSKFKEGKANKGGHLKDHRGDDDDDGLDRARGRQTRGIGSVLGSTSKSVAKRSKKG